MLYEPFSLDSHFSVYTSPKMGLSIIGIYCWFPQAFVSGLPDDGLATEFAGSSAGEYFCLGNH